jgi:hypothetical protein
MVAPLRVTDVLSESVTYVLGTFSAITHNVSHVCDVAPSPTRARGRCGDEARRSAEEPEAPSEAPMHIRAVMGSCAILILQSDHCRSRLFRGMENHSGRC